jgi:hypothetical protein
MTDFHPAPDEQLLRDLQRELARLEAERARAIEKRDRALSTVETGDDSGFLLSIALKDLKRIEARIEQIQFLAEKQRQRGNA